MNIRLSSRHFYLKVVSTLLCVMSCYNLKILAQVSIDTLVLEVEALTVDDGLSAGYVNNLTQDSFGYLWISTMQGLNRYDGRSIKEYVHRSGDTNSWVFVDSRNWLWVHTSSGLSLFDYKSESFYPIKSDLVKNDGLVNIKEDEIGNLWVFGKDYEWVIVSIDAKWKQGASVDYHLLTQECKVVKAIDYFLGLPEGVDLKGMLLTSNQSLWWEHNDSLYAYSLDFENRRASFQFKRSISLSYNQRHSRLIENVNNNSVWFVEKERIQLLNLFTGKSTQTYLLKDMKKDIFPSAIDDQGRVWIRSLDTGLSYRFDPKKKTISFLQAKDNKRIAPYALELNRCFIDKNENLWNTSTGYGVLKYNLKRERFNKFKDFSAPHLGNLIEIGKDSILIGSRLSIFNNQRLTPFFKNNNILEELRYSNYKHGSLDGKGNIFINYYYNGGQEVTPNGYLSDKKGNVSYLKNIVDKNDLASDRFFFDFENHLCKIGEDDTSKYITIYKWKNLIENPTKKFVFSKDDHSVFAKEIFEPYVADNGKLWIPSIAGGLYMCDFKSNRWEHFEHKANKPTSISSNQVFCILPDSEFPDSILWIGTGNGLNQFNIPTEEFDRYSTADGLPNNVIYSILSDHKNNLWLGTNRGLCLFNPKTLSARNFTVEDGLQHTEFNKESYLKASDGRLYFAGMGGLNHFDPKDFYTDKPSSKVVINGLRINNEEVPFSNTAEEDEVDFALESPLEYESSLSIPHDKRMITFEFALLDFTQPQGHTFKYRLDGFEDEWINAKYQNEATFTNLSPGSYIFEVQAFDHQGVLHPETASIQLNILPPWWDTWWFRGLLTLSIFGILFLVYWNRKRQKEDLQNLRNRISQDLHDEIGSTLSSISLFGLVAEKEMERDKALAKKMLGMIGSNTLSTMESLNDIVWAINSRNDKMEHVIQRMRSFTTELDDASEWRIHFDYTDAIKELEISMIHRRNTYLIFKEAVNNAIKYSKGQHLNIRLDQNGSTIMMEIIDDGQGFDKERTKEERSMGGNGLINMERRADELGGQLVIESNSKGTRIYLTFNINHKINPI